MLADEGMREIIFRFNNKKEVDFRIGDSNHGFVLNSHLKDLVPLKNHYKEFPESFLCYFNSVDLNNVW